MRHRRPKRPERRPLLGSVAGQSRSIGTAVRYRRDCDDTPLSSAHCPYRYTLMTVGSCFLFLFKFYGIFISFAFSRSRDAMLRDGAAIAFHVLFLEFFFF